MMDRGIEANGNGVGTSPLQGGRAPMADCCSRTLAPHPNHFSSFPDGKDGQAADVLVSVFSVLELAGITYCVVHGYEGLPHRRGSDIDCIVDSRITAAQLLTLFRNNESEIGAKIVRANGYFFTVCWSGHNGLPEFLSFDFSHDYCFGSHLICSGTEILSSRKKYRCFWIPSAEVEFPCSLARSLLKKGLGADRALKLSSLYRESPSACAAALSKYWSQQRRDEICAAAASGNWATVRKQAPALQSELKRRLFMGNPGKFCAAQIRTQLARLSRLLRPSGINVVLLGPDGAGKSSTVSVLESVFAPLFARVEVHGFAPSLRQMLRRQPTSTSQPHALKPRSLPISLLRAGYWMMFNTIGYLGLHWAKARSTLIINDRHFVDILVDPVRYRYGGPTWLLQLIWRIMPKPELVILLQGPAEVLQARKKELSLAETERQCRDYLAIVEPMKNGRIINATQPFEGVVRDVSAVILDHLRMRLKLES